MYRVPIVMLAKRDKSEAATLEAKASEAGAVALTVLPPAGQTTVASQEDLVRTVRTMAEVKVVRRRGQRVAAEPSSPRTPTSSSATGQKERGPLPELQDPVERVEIVAIGASTGGPQVLETILRGVAPRLTVPVLIVQHLSQGFQKNLVAWLAEATGVRLLVAEHGMPLAPGTVYMAPDNKHMGVNASRCVVLADDPPENGSRPSVSALFRSVAESYGSRAIGILLSGMGRDGAKELRLMREGGALTIAQDEESSAVHGMPGEAIKLKGARYVLPPERIVSVLQRHLPATPVSRKETVPCL